MDLSNAKNPKAKVDKVQGKDMPCFSSLLNTSSLHVPEP